MPWRQITSANVTGRMTVAEQAMMVAVQGVAAKLPERLADSVGKFIGAMNAVGYATKSDGSVPDQLRNNIMADAVWEWLKDAPGLDKFKTKAREKAYDDAQTVVDSITNKTYGPIEPPVVTQLTGNWNSEQKLIGRMHPTPPPALQFGNVGNPQPEYANPNGASDAVQETIAQPPANLFAFPTAIAGQVQLVWSPPLDAVSFNVYRSGVSGQETLLVNTKNQGNYLDTITSGQQAFYYVTSVNPLGESAQSNEANAIAK